MAKTDSNDLQSIINQLTLFIHACPKNKGPSIYFNAVIEYIENTLSEWATKNTQQETIIETLDKTLLQNLKEHIADKQLVSTLTENQLKIMSELIELLAGLSSQNPAKNQLSPINCTVEDIEEIDQPMPFGIELRP